MSFIWHFGDSYGRMDEGFSYSSKHFVHICADNIKYEYKPNSQGGISNEMIYANILKNLSLYKSDDIIFINWSFFQRASFWDSINKNVRSTNVLYNEMENIISDYKWEDTIIKNIIPMLDYYINNPIDYNMRLFHLINLTLSSLEKSGIKIYYIFADNSEYESDLLKCGSNLKFENGFAKWLKKNGLHKNQDLHYTYGIQIPLSDMILKRTINFTIKEKIIHLSINDFNKDLITKKENLL
jgi:hypothetical protein